MLKALAGKLSLPEKIVYQWYVEVSAQNRRLEIENEHLQAKIAHLQQAVDKTMLQRYERFASRVEAASLDQISWQAEKASLLGQLNGRYR